MLRNEDLNTVHSQRNSQRVHNSSCAGKWDLREYINVPLHFFYANNLKVGLSNTREIWNFTRYSIEVLRFWKVIGHSQHINSLLRICSGLSFNALFPENFIFIPTENYLLILGISSHSVFILCIFIICSISQNLRCTSQLIYHLILNNIFLYSYFGYLRPTEDKNHTQSVIQ